MLKFSNRARSLYIASASPSLMKLSYINVPRSSPDGVTFAAKKSLECMTKLRAEYRVNDGIQRRIEIAQPQKEGEKVLVEDANL